MTIDEFRQVDLRVAKVLAAERIPGSEKLLRLSLNAGDKSEAGLPAERRVLAGIGKAYEPAELVGREVVIVANLEPRILMGEESQGMLLAASLPGQGGADDVPVMLTLDREVEPGSKIR